MPSPTHQQYRGKASINSQFARALQASNIRSPEWVVVVAFYSAVHYVQAYLAQTSLQIEPHNHQERKWYVNTVEQLKQIRKEYSRLSDKAWEARYTMTSFSPEYAQTLLDEDLLPLEEHILSLI